MVATPENYEKAMDAMGRILDILKETEVDFEQIIIDENTERAQLRIDLRKCK